jgi:hypothetical protein
MCLCIVGGEEQRFTHAKRVTQTEMTIYRSMEPGIGFEQDRPVGAAGAAGHCPTLGPKVGFAGPPYVSSPFT